MDEMTPQRLRYFVEASRRGSFRMAAEVCHISQPALSAQVRVLERAVGAPLFERSKQGVLLTTFGKELLPRVEDILGALDRLAEFSNNFRRGDEGVVSIACYPVHLERFLAVVLGTFQDEHPRVGIDLARVRDDRRRGSGRTLFEELAAGDVDLAMGPPHLNLGLDGFKAYDAKIVMVVSDDHLLRRATHVSVNELRDLPVLIAPPNFFSRTTVEAACQRAGFGLRVAAHSSSPPALVALGKSGVGVPVLPDDYSLVGQREHPYPVLTDEDGNEISTPVWLQWRQGAELSPATRGLLECAQTWVERERISPGAAAFKGVSLRS